MSVKTDSRSARGLKAIAESIIIFDISKGAADTPVWWICLECLKKHFGTGAFRIIIQ
jgi:hypothetical protein